MVPEAWSREAPDPASLRHFEGTPGAPSGAHCGLANEMQIAGKGCHLLAGRRLDPWSAIGLRSRMRPMTNAV